MADPFLDDEGSAQSSRVIEYYDVAVSTGVTYRIAQGDRDLPVGSIVYKASPIARAELVIAQVSDASNEGGLTLSLPCDHAIVRRWFQLGVPPRQTSVTVWRRQERSGLAERVWYGLVTSISVDGEIAKLLVPARSIDSMTRSLPTISAGPSCPHILYDTQCRVDRTAFKVATTAILVDGRTVRVDLGSTAKNGDWTEDGELLHVATGERMTIAKQTDLSPGVTGVADLDMQLPIPELKGGDAIEVYAGCKKGIAICQLKFANKDNYGGSPRAPSRNPFLFTDRIL